MKGAEAAITSRGPSNVNAPQTATARIPGSLYAESVLADEPPFEARNASAMALRDANDYEPPVAVDVLIEIPRGSFLKRGSTGRIDFVSPFPCPFNYGSVPTHLGLEGDLLDAVVLGPRLAAGTRLTTKAWDAITLTDRGMCDDKLICSELPLDAVERDRVLRFFEFYAKCKGLLNLWRRRPGRNACEGWCGLGTALSRARLRGRTWAGPSVPY